METRFSFTKLRHQMLAITLCIVPTVVIAATNVYKQQNLVSDGAIPADHVDPNLINPWGLAFGPTTPAWVANAGTGTSTIYTGSGNPLPLVVRVPPAPSVGGKGTPTGVVFNNTSSFIISSAGKTAPATFIFATEDGTLSGWSPSVNTTNAIIMVDNSSNKAVYKGLARAANGKNDFLYATNFRSGQIDVFDSSFHPITTSGGFIDPDLPDGFAPFGIQNILGDLYVSYAKQDDMKKDEVRGKGLGLVNVFDADGNFIRRVVADGVLNAPWGMALAPASFGRYKNTLLVANFGDGKINSFNPLTGVLQGTLNTASRKPLVIDGLWSITFGNGTRDQATNALFFTAGPVDETHGLYGVITPVID